MKKFIVHSSKFIVIICITLFTFVSTSYARATVENLAQVEKLFMEGKYERVVSDADKLIDARAAGREELFYLKALSQTQLGGFSAARQTFDYMLERYPRGKRAFDACIGIGDAYFLEGKTAESITSYNEGLNRYPDHKNAVIAYYKIAGAYEKLGNTAKAREYFNKVKNGSPLSFESSMITKDTGGSNINIVPQLEEKKGYEETPAGNFYYIQAGYFKSKYNAEKLTEKLKQAGYDSYMSVQSKAGFFFYRVKVGRFKSKSEAEIVARKLKADGYKTKVCR